MIRIDSDQNPRIKRLKSLRDKRGRQKEKAYFIEGEKHLYEALRDRPGEVREVFVTDRYQGELPDTVPVFRLGESLFSTLTQQKSPQGVLAVLQIPEASRLGYADRVLIVDRMTDPGNLGTVIRTAEAFDFQLCLLGNTVDPYNPKVVQASMGSIIRNAPVLLRNSDLSHLKTTHALYGAVLDGGRAVSEVELPNKIAIVIGSESHGISEECLALLDERIYIPMSGRTESLNAAVAAAILMQIVFSTKG